MKVLLLHCVNHSMFGKKDPKQYGTITLDEINGNVQALADKLGVELETFCTNFEGEIVERIHKGVLDKVDAVLINAGAWTHYSWALHDALHMIEGPIYELHMSNVHKRDEWRHHSVVSSIAQGILIGMGADVYTLGLQAAYNYLTDNQGKI